MPSVSSRQERFMQAVAHDKEFAKKVHVSQEVGKDFVEADKAKKARTSRMYKNQD